MRIWLVEHTNQGEALTLETLLRQLEGRPETELRVVGTSANPSECVLAARNRELVVDLIVVREQSWPEEGWLKALLSLGVAVALAVEPEKVPRYLEAAEHHSLGFIPSRVDGPQSLWVSLRGVLASHAREVLWKQQAERLEQRLNDRIVIERAKGVLIQCLGISEEDAYQRLRVLARQQQRRMRDVAQSLLNTRTLFQHKPNELVAPGRDGTRRDPVNGGDPLEERSGLRHAVAACPGDPTINLTAQNDYSVR